MISLLQDKVRFSMDLPQLLEQSTKISVRIIRGLRVDSRTERFLLESGQLTKDLLQEILLYKLPQLLIVAQSQTKLLFQYLFFIIF